jgi:hypothetical protein
MSDLEQKLNALIAEEDKVQPEDVTLEHIRQTRDRNEDVKYDFSTQYGGFNRRNGKVLNPHQSRDLIAAAYSFLGRFSRHR